VNLLGDNIDTIKKNRGTLIDASKKVGLKVNAEKTNYVLLSRHRNKGQHHSINMDPLKMGTVQTFGNDINKSKFDSGGN
jgi:hypothetical protein